MVVILQPASRLPVTIFTAMTNNCQQDECKSSLVNRVTSCLFSFVVEFSNGFKMEGGGGERKTVAPKIPRVVCLSHPCTFRHSSEGRQIRPAELGIVKQTEF